MANMRCPGEECDYEGSLKAVEVHMRKCPHYAKVWLHGTPLSPKEAYAAAHPPAPARRARAAPPSDGDAPPVDAAGPDAGSEAPPDGVLSPSPQGSSPQDEPSPARPRRTRRGARASAAPPLISSTSSGKVSVEYWDWEPTLLESLRADAADRQ